MRKLIYCIAIAGLLAGSPVSAKKIVSYNPSHIQAPAPERETSRTEPSKPPVITVKVEWNGTCLQMIYVPTGTTIWEVCF